MPRCQSPSLLPFALLPFAPYGGLLTQVALLGLGPGLPDLLSPRAIDRLARADVALIDDSITDSCWRPHLPAQCVVHPVGTSPNDERLARDAMKEQANAGRRVVRGRRGEGWRSPAALRDARVLRSAGIAFEMVPGADADAAAWQIWLDDRALFGRRIVVTRMRAQAADTLEELRERGADPWSVPTIELHPSPDPEAFDAALREVRSYAVVAFTSANGVQQAFSRLEVLGKDAREMSGCLVAAIGTATARALRDVGIRADIVAKEFRGEELAREILGRMPEGRDRRVLIPRAKEAREVLPAMLRDAGCSVDVVPAYETSKPGTVTIAPLCEALSQGEVDAVLLTSSSTMKNLAELLGDGYRKLLQHTSLASIGPITSATVLELGLEVAVEAERYTMDGLIEALERHFAR